MHEKFDICYIYDEISAGFYWPQLLQIAYETVACFAAAPALGWL